MCSSLTTVAGCSPRRTCCAAARSKNRLEPNARASRVASPELKLGHSSFAMRDASATGNSARTFQVTIPRIFASARSVASRSTARMLSTSLTSTIDGTAARRASSARSADACAASSSTITIGLRAGNPFKNASSRVPWPGRLSHTGRRGRVPHANSGSARKNLVLPEPPAATTTRMRAAPSTKARKISLSVTRPTSSRSGWPGSSNSDGYPTGTSPGMS